MISFRKNTGGNKTNMIIPFLILGQSIAVVTSLFLNYDYWLFQGMFIPCKDNILFHKIAVARELQLTSINTSELDRTLH